MTLKDNTDQTPEDERGREENKDAPAPHIHSPDCEHCSEHEELTDEDEVEDEDEGDEEEEEVDIMDEDIVLEKIQLNSPMAAMFDQFLEGITPEDLVLPEAEQSVVSNSIRMAYMAGALDLLRLQRNGVVVASEGGDYMQQGYSLIELEAEIREELGIDEGAELTLIDSEEEEEIGDETKSVMKNIIGGKLH